MTKLALSLLLTLTTSLAAAAGTGDTAASSSAASPQAAPPKMAAPAQGGPAQRGPAMKADTRPGAHRGHDHAGERGRRAPAPGSREGQGSQRPAGQAEQPHGPGARPAPRAGQDRPNQNRPAQDRAGQPAPSRTPAERRAAEVARIDALMKTTQDARALGYLREAKALLAGGQDRAARAMLHAALAVLSPAKPQPDQTKPGQPGPRR